MQISRNKSGVVSILGLLVVLLIGGIAIGCSDEKVGTSEAITERPGDETTGDPTTTLVDHAVPVTTPDGKPARYAFSSGVIEMEYKGMLVGTRRTSFDNWGLRERTWDSAEAANPPIPLVPPQSIAIMTPTSYAAVDLRAAQAHTGPNEALERMVAESKATGRSVGELAMAGSDAARVADTTLLDRYRCRVYRRTGSGMTRTIYVWGGIPIGESVIFAGNVKGGYRVFPTKIELDVTLDDTLFDLPEGLTVKPFEKSTE